MDSFRNEYGDLYLKFQESCSLYKQKKTSHFPKKMVIHMQFKVGEKYHSLSFLLSKFDGEKNHILSFLLSKFDGEIKNTTFYHFFLSKFDKYLL